MTEREKMLAGELYDCADEELLLQWHKAKDLVREYNHTQSMALTEKREILERLLGKCGNNLWITPPFYVDYGNNIEFGNNCEVNMNCTFLDDNKIIIGDNALIAPNVQIYTAYHPLDARDRFSEQKKDGSFEFCKTQTAPVKIGKNVWIGGGAMILPGVTIGDNVVIGAGSVVTKDIPDNKVAAGNPCRIIRDNIRIRTAQMEDLDRITEVERQCFPEAEAAKRDSMEKRIRYFAEHFWLLEVGEEVVGFVNGMVTNEEHLHDEMYDRAEMHEEEGSWQMIFGVDVIPAYQKRGLAGQLLKYVIAAAKSENRKGIVLTCKEHMIPFYKKFGFEDEGRSESEHGGALWHEMRLIL